MPKGIAPSPTATRKSDRLVVKTAAPAPRLTGGVRTVYAATIVISAFLLFLIQPVLGKVILPWFGGVASVWTVAILFFQGMLLFGYTYAYLTIRYLPPWAQALLHVTLLSGSVFLLPLSPWRVWQPGTEGDPAIQILKVLLWSAGLPYLLVHDRTIGTGLGSRDHNESLFRTAFLLFPTLEVWPHLWHIRFWWSLI
jgi:hypothetical protein